MDVAQALGETWQDRGTLYLPVPGGGEAVVDLERYPLVRFGTGVHALLDFSQDLDRTLGDLVTSVWRNYRIVSIDGGAGAAAAVSRLLEAAGYYAVKDGTAHPVVIGEAVSVEIPARFVVLKTKDALATGEVYLIKEAAEKPAPELEAVIAYAGRVGIRVVPFSADETLREGFVAGLAGPDDAGETGAPPRAVPSRALAAVDFALEYLGLPGKEDSRLQIRGGGGAFSLTVQPDRVFEAGGKTYVVDAGRMAAPVLALVRQSGYVPLALRRDEPGIVAFRRVLAAAGVEPKPVRGHLLAGGEKDGFAVRVTGSLLPPPQGPAGRGARAAVLVRGKVHTATAALLRRLGIEAIGW